ncbi:MAG: hypothetical protein LC687_02010, partial [Actinobacteria bacterium]|nr:hypothetical protein [Actinomycetota bacterium]
MKSAMISCVQRRDTERPITLRELAKVGIHPHVVESPCNPAGGPQNRQAAFRALQRAGGEGLLFLEDDIIVNEFLFPDMLHQAEERGVVTTFTCFRDSLHPKGTFDSMTPRLVKLVNTQERRGFYGTQAIYLPKWAVELALEDWASFVNEDGSPLPACHGFDFWIKNHIPNIYMAFPNPIDHR